MDDAIDLLVLHQLIEGLKVTDIHLHELVVRLVLDILEVRKITRLGKLIKVDDIVFWIFVHEESYYVRSDETGSTGNYYISFHKVLV